MTVARSCRASEETVDHTDQVQALHAAIRRFIHDLNNPLAAASINAELLSQAIPDDANTRRLTTNLIDQLDRIKEVVAGLDRLTKPSSS